MKVVALLRYFQSENSCIQLQRKKILPGYVVIKFTYKTLPSFFINVYSHCELPAGPPLCFRFSANS